MMRRKVGSVICSLALAVATFSQSVAAISVGPQPPVPTAPDLIITSILDSKSASTLDMVELYNQSGAPINLAGWKVAFSFGACSGDSNFLQDLPSAWILSKHYLTFSNSGDLTNCAQPWLSSVKLYDANGITEQTVTIPTSTSLPADKIAQQKQRSNSSSSSRMLTGDFATDYPLKTPPPSPAPALFSDPLYLPPEDDSGLQILEILPNSRDCSPLSTDLTCGDYIKLYNPTSSTIDLSQYRLRVGYKGQSSSISNTFTWGQNVDPQIDELDLPAHHYLTLNTRNDGDALNLSDSGNYVWLEDAYGVQAYSPVVEYPSASSTSKIGWAWAFDGAAWRWTSAPQPNGPNYYPPQVPAENSNSSGSSTFKPCKANQYRSVETNRCRTIVSASTLVPCKPNQERNPETNRCKSLLASSSGLVPCKVGQARNPETNRCKSATSSSTLKPCQSGWTRNTETNRCRKTSDVKGASINQVHDVQSPAAASGVHWLLIALAIASAIAYAFYEWRQEIRLKLVKIKSDSFHLRLKK